MLHGMAPALKECCRRLGRRLRVYLPFGEMLPGMAYLVRRLLENTSNESFQRISLTGTSRRGAPGLADGRAEPRSPRVRAGGAHPDRRRRTTR